VTKEIFRKKSTWIISSTILLLVLARIILPEIILKKTNDYLGSFSPLYALHAGDMHFHVLRIGYSFDDLEGHLKQKPIEFLTIKKLRVFLAVRELFHAKFVVDVIMDETNLKVTQESLNALSGYSKDQAKSDAKNIKDSTVPFDLERLTVKDSSFEFSDVGGLPPEQSFYLKNVNGEADNLTPAPKQGMSVFAASGDVQGSAKTKIVGQFKPNLTPVDWSINLKLKDLDLTTFNPIARRMVPLTFKSGKLTLFLAAQSIQGKMIGYMKPFLKDTVFIGDRGDFKNVGQFFIEIAGTIGNFLLKNSKTNTLAAKISFKEVNGKFETDTGQALKTAIDNATGDTLSQKFDETLDLNN
jgi:hypothetical protein